jgi:hypothetical protein
VQCGVFLNPMKSDAANADIPKDREALAELRVLLEESKKKRV